MRILFTSDWQATLSNLDRCDAALEQVLATIAWKEKIDHFVHLGDIKEQFNNIDVRVINFAVSMVKKIRAAGVPVWIVPGNHDYISTQSPIHFLPALEEAGALVFSQDTMQVSSHGVSVWAVPYLRAAEDNDKAFKFVTESRLKQDKNDKNILLFHNEVVGAEYRGSKHSKGALKLPWKQFDICIGGHIHRQQNIPGTNIWYVGSPFCCTWGEANEQKGYLIWDSSKPNTVKPVPSTIPGWYDPALPGFAAPKSWAGATVRVTTPVDYEDPTLLRARARIERRYPGATVILTPEHLAPSKANATQLTGTDADILKAYIRDQTLPPNSSVDQLCKYIMDLLPAGGLGIQGLQFNFVAGRNTLCFDSADLPLNRQGLTLVTGVNTDWPGQRSNGSGKSTLLGLICLLLFGETPKGQKHDRWIRKGQKSGAVTGELMLSNGRKMRIARSRNPNQLLVQIDGKDVTMGDANATQRLIETYTGLTWDVFTNSMYVGQAEVGSVFGTDKERKELFSRLLGLERFIRATDALRKRILVNKAQISTLDGEVLANEAAVREARSELERVATRLTEATPAKDVAALRQKREQCTAQISKMNAQSVKLDEWLAANQQRYETYLNTALEANADAKALRKQLDAAVTAGQDRKCPVCGSVIKGQQLDQHCSEIESRVSVLEKQYNKFNSMCTDNRKKREAPYRQAGQLNEALRQVTAQIAAMDLEIQKLEQAAAVRRQLEADWQRQQQRVAALEAAGEAHTRARAALLEHEEFLTFCLKVVGRDGVPAYLSSLVAPQLNAAAAKYSLAFSGGEIGLRFKIADGDIDVELTNLHGGETVQDQSMGEMRMAGLIAAFAFRDVLVPHNLLILDEPSEGFDAANARAFAAGLQSIVERFGTVFLTTHNAEILNEIQPDYHLQVTKKDGVSRVEEL